MSSWKHKVDHGSFAIKYLLRKQLIKKIEPSAAVDFYAGEGRLLSLYAGFPSVHAVEKDPKKWARLQQAVSRLYPGRVRTYLLDNRVFMRAVLPGIAEANLLDFDAYGNPHPAIHECFRRFRPRGRTAIAVTDGGRLALIRGWKINLASYLPGAFDSAPELSARLNPLLVREYELLVNRFWSRLAHARGFQIIETIFAWKKARRVLYYGVVIEPDRHHMDRDRAHPSQPLEPEPDAPRQIP